jgi:hypothetical protein
VRAESGQAVSSDVLIFDIPSELVTSTPPAATQTVMPTFTTTPSPTVTLTPTPEATPVPPDVNSQGTVDFGDWLAALIVIALISGGSYRFISLKYGLRWGVRAALLPLIGGMFTYTYVAINLPGSGRMMGKMGTWGVLLIVILGAAIGFGGLLIWQQLENRKTKPVKA